MSFTSDQEKIVLKILSYKPHQFYEILAVEKTANDGEIKKSYRKLAIKLHPDKNPHPRAAEAFKFLNKAWGVLSDPSKKTIFDQTGSDPDSRFGAGGSSDSGSSPFARGPGATTSFSGFQNGGGMPFDDDIFNLFFGGAGARQGPTFTFGGNGFSFQSFGGGDPFVRQTQTHQRTRTSAQQQRPEDVNVMEGLKQLLPLLLFLLIPIISGLFSGSESVPDYSFVKTKSHNLERKTPNHKITFYVAENYNTKKKLTTRQMESFDRKVENIYVQDKTSKCSREQVIKNEMIEDAHGWFYTDYDKLREAENLPMPNCKTLRKLGLL